MNRKRLFCLLTALMVAVVLPLSAVAEEKQEFFLLEGYVQELVEDGFLLVDKTMGDVICNTDDATILEGDLAEDGVQVGDYVLVEYDGRLTRSIPPQTHAERVSCFVLEGEVVEIIDETTVAVNTEENGEVWVHAAEMPSMLLPGMNVTVYYDGVMAMSLPAQIGAREMVVREMTGAVVDMTDNGFLLQIDDENQVEVTVDGLTYFSRLNDQEVTVGEETETTTVEEMLYAPEKEEIPEEEAAEPSDEETAQEEDASAAEEPAAPAINRAEEYLTVSDIVTVYYRSLLEDMPVSAVKVVILP